MSIFSAIRDAIFGGPASAMPIDTQSEGKAPSGQSQLPTAGTVDVAAMLDKLSKESDEDFDWRRSIVDLMKLLKLDSSLKSRKSLAKELGYTGDADDSATMNIWLHKQVMTKLAEHGGTVPPELTH